MRRSSLVSMRMRWRVVLCPWGLTLFGLLTYGSMRVNSIRLNANISPLHHPGNSSENHVGRRSVSGST